HRRPGRGHARHPPARRQVRPAVQDGHARRAGARPWRAAARGRPHRARRPPRRGRPAVTPVSGGTHAPGIRLLLLADTHLPRRAKDLPDAVWAEVERADVVVHAGDWVEVDLLDRLEARSRRVLACWGNNDGSDLRQRLPEVARAELAGVRVA